MNETVTRKVLLVDDVEFIVDVMQGYLKNTPVKTFHAENGRQAVDMALLHWPDLVVMDVAMPDMNGVEACQELRKHPKLKEVPVILLYDPERDPSPDELKNSGCDDLIIKPLSREDFLTTTHRHLFHIDRRERRAPCQTTVDFTVKGETLRGLGIDVSRNGMYVEFRDRDLVKSNVDLSFLLATVSEKPVFARGRIVWVNQGHPRPNLNMPQGFGVEFQMISEEAQAIINKYLEEN